MKRKRLWTLLAAVTIGALMLGACSRAGATPTPAPTRTTVRERVVRETVALEVEKQVGQIAEREAFHLQATPTPATAPGLPIYGGETLPNDGWKGDTLLARIQWGTPNRLVV